VEFSSLQSDLFIIGNREVEFTPGEPIESRWKKLMHAFTSYEASMKPSHLLLPRANAVEFADNVAMMFSTATMGLETSAKEGMNCSLFYQLVGPGCKRATEPMSDALPPRYAGEEGRCKLPADFKVEKQPAKLTPVDKANISKAKQNLETLIKLHEQSKKEYSACTNEMKLIDTCIAEAICLGQVNIPYVDMKKLADDVRKKDQAAPTTASSTSKTSK
jgi:hypothetical protein